ncbi:hypothetical protein QR680_015869 [Steinernema hermaphroditum]|uniref:Nematode cuticle collagen N-terminal domain-containing protein n=1 Tax=Steinernema hermaphroditum TaxID=289476 RepID=A0AA39HB40_9BILA|nr:hypothetical protein QR680_015869 [Steinernema hermaphroditum]
MFTTSRERNPLIRRKRQYSAEPVCQCAPQATSCPPGPPGPPGENGQPGEDGGPDFYAEFHSAALPVAKQNTE